MTLPNAGVLAFALVAMIAWGFWAVFADLATRSLAPELAMIVSYLVGALVAIGYAAIRDAPLSFHATGIGFALLAGIFSGVGAVSYYYALQQGSAAIATTVTALYFVVAAVLAIVFFGESLGASDVIGIAFAALAVLLIAR